MVMPSLCFDRSCSCGGARRYTCYSRRRCSDLGKLLSPSPRESEDLSRPGRSAIWVVFESVKRRLPKSLSDLDGTDPLIHGGTVRGVFRGLSNAFVNSR